MPCLALPCLAFRVKRLCRNPSKSTQAISNRTSTNCLPEGWCFWQEKLFFTYVLSESFKKTKQKKQKHLIPRTGSLLNFHNPKDRLCAVTQRLIDYLQTCVVTPVQVFQAISQVTFTWQEATIKSCQPRQKQWLFCVTRFSLDLIFNCWVFICTVQACKAVKCVHDCFRKHQKF